MTKRMGIFGAAAAVALAAGVAPAASAAGVVTYKASNYTGGAYGLWTNDLGSGSAIQYSFQDDVRFVLDTDTGQARLTGTAKNNLGAIAVLDLTFANPLESLAGTGFIYKREGGIAYDVATDSPDIDFFSAGAGTITIGGTAYTLAADPFAGNTLFQYGTGANAKNATDFGGSSWLLVDGRANHWDLNFKLQAVPEPATWGLLLLGFGAIGGAMRRRVANRTTTARVHFA